MNGNAEGGAVHAGLGNITVIASSLNKNQVIGGSSFVGGFAHGGAIDAESGDVTISHDSHVNTNSAAAGTGMGGGVYARNGNVTVHSSTISKNQVEGGHGFNGTNPGVSGADGGGAFGGGVFMGSSNDTLTIDKTSGVSAAVNSNSVTGGAGGNGANGMNTGGGTTPGHRAQNGGNGGDGGDAQGGGVWVNGGTILISDTSMNKNSIEAGDAGVGGVGGRGATGKRGGSGAGGDGGNANGVAVLTPILVTPRP